MFRPNCPLQNYLIRKLPSYNFLLRHCQLSLGGVLSLLQRILEAEELVDDTNPTVILTDPELESALGVRALHATELRGQIIKQLVRSGSEEAQTPMPPFPPGPDLPKLLPRPPAVRQVQIGERFTKGVSPGTPIALNQRFRVKPEFLKILQTNPGTRPRQEVFTFEFVSKALGDYIKSNKDTLIDPRHITIVICEHDQLGKAFQVRAFHRSQAMILVRQCLVPMPGEKPVCRRNCLAALGYY